MKLSTRLSIAMVALVAFTAAIIGMASYRMIEAALVPAALERLAAHTRLHKAEILSQLQGMQADVIGFSSGPGPDGIVRARLNGGIDPIGGASESDWLARFASRLIPIVASKPAYYQFRIAELADGGRELFRVDRVIGNSARMVSDADKARIGDTDYFRAAAGLPWGEIYFSPIEIAHPGGPNTPARTLMHIATPIQSADRKPFGIFALTIDVETLLSLRDGAPDGNNVYAVDAAGRYLLHPDRARELAVAPDAPGVLQDFPGLSDLLTAEDGAARVITDANNESFGAAVMPLRLGGGPRIAVIETAPYSAITALAKGVQQTGLLVGLFVALCAIALAMLLARSLSEPLAKMTTAITEFGRSRKMTVPVAAGGEVGVLARAFESMANEIKARSIKLRDYALRERFYIAAVESSSYAFITADSDGYITAWNPGAESLFGYTADEAIGQHIVTIVPDDKLEEHRSNREKIKRLERVTNCHTVRLAKGGRRVDVVLDGAPIRSRSGSLRGSALIARDVSTEKLAHDMFRLAVQACPSGMIMVDLDGNIVMLNTETERLFGYARKELLHQSVDLLVPDSLRHQHVLHREAFVADPQTRRMGIGGNLFGRRKDGTEFPVEVGLNPISTREGTVMILGVIVDISERVRNERLKDEFVSTVSHELRTPLTSIAGSLGLLTGGATGPMAEPAMRLLKIAHKNSERLVRLINDILDIEKMESGKIVFDLKRVDVLALAEQAIEANRGFAEKYGVRLRLDPAAANASVRADPDRLMQVLTNLLSNAIKFSPQGEEVLANIQRHANRVRISVRDHGIGIPEEFKTRIFEKFAQADGSDARQKSGTGLGLSIVKKIVTLLGGTVGFESVAKVGTTFYVDLPSWELVAGADAATADADWASPLQLLVVDDDAAVASIISGRLAMNGFSPDIALRADDALRKAQAKRYDAIAVDLNLPDRDGISLIQELRSQPQYQNTPIVVISADAASGHDDVRSSSLDVLDWLNKPIDIAHLTSVIERPLARNRSKRPHVLHVDDDEGVLRVVASAVGQSCAVTSVSSIEDARKALSAQHFDLVVLDLLLSQASGLDLLPELRDRDGNALPVILYSARAANVTNAAQVCAALTKSQKSIDHLVLTLRKHVAPRHAAAQHDREVA